MKSEIIKKYEKMVENIRWHLRVNKPTDEMEIKKCNQQINDYTEFINDINALSPSPLPAAQQCSAEYIVCSAIRYFNILKDEIIICGLRHNHCINTWYVLTGKRTQDEEQGFLTSENRFVTRIEAGKIALACGQIKELRYYGGKMLDSSDLYKSFPAPDNCVNIDDLITEFELEGIKPETWDGEEGAVKAIVGGVRRWYAMQPMQIGVIPTVIKCPECQTIQGAVIEKTIPFGTYIHDCVKCGYKIMESEWDTVEPFLLTDGQPAQGYSREQMRLMAYGAFKFCANAFRMYPNSKHTFSDYWTDYGEASIPTLPATAEQDEWVEFVMYLTEYKREQVIKQLENWKRNIKETKTQNHVGD